MVVLLRQQTPSETDSCIFPLSLPQSKPNSRFVYNVCMYIFLSTSLKNPSGDGGVKMYSHSQVGRYSLLLSVNTSVYSSSSLTTAAYKDVAPIVFFVSSGHSSSVCHCFPKFYCCSSHHNILHHAFILLHLMFLHLSAI